MVAAKRSEQIFNAHVMQTFQIKTHAKGSTYNQPHFFILCKGNNCGKPLTEPCANCFVLLCKEGNKDLMYWMMWGLWKAKAFHFYLRGSVIPFIKIEDARLALSIALKNANDDKTELANAIKVLRTFEELEKNYLERKALIDDYRRIVFQRYMKK